MDAVEAGAGVPDVTEGPKSAAQRQAERKARQIAAGLVQFKLWVHPDDVPPLTAYAEALARKRVRKVQTGAKSL